MAACQSCSALGKKLHKRWYMQYKVYICTECSLKNADQFDEELVNGHC
jgi:hypothetical protein